MCIILSRIHAILASLFPILSFNHQILMYIIESYSTAVFFCIITMIAWGSSSNTQKLVSPNWRVELFAGTMLSGY